MARKTFKKYGITFADSPRSLTTLVDAHDKRKATRADDHECPIAQSLRRQQGVEAVSVGANFVYIKWIGKRIVDRFALSKDDRKMVKDYDRGAAPFKAGAITLLPPPVSVRIGARAGQKPGTNTRQGKSKNALNWSPPERHVRMPG